MSISRTTLWLSVLVAVAGLCSPASAQFPATTHQFGGAGFWEPDHLGLVNPQIPLNYFEPDWQFFAPADVSTFGGYPEPNIGFFFTYDRLYWNVQRREGGDPLVAQQWEGDFTWGNRVEFGYMMDTDHGWLVSLFHLDGPNEQIIANQQTIVSPFDPNNVALQTDIEGINLGRFEGAEINKTFRWKPVGKNYIIEPMFGVRFMKFLDRPALVTSVVELDAAGLVVNQAILGGENQVENNILGGQLGVRIHHQTERWEWAVESKFVPAINWQFYSPQVVATNGTTLTEVVEPGEDFNEFTIFGQVRLVSTYNLTRDISIGGGFDLMYFGRGIARGRTYVNEDGNIIPRDLQNDQDLFIGGFSMLLQVNR